MGVLDDAAMVAMATLKVAALAKDSLVAEATASVVGGMATDLAVQGVEAAVVVEAGGLGIVEAMVRGAWHQPQQAR